MGFASGLSAGMGLVTSMRNLYNESEQARLMAEKKRLAGLGDYQRYSQADADKLQEYASATNEQGQPMYRLSIDPGSTQYRVQQIMYPDIPQQSSSLDFVVPDRAPVGLAPQPITSSDAQSYGVPMDVLPEERVLTPGSASSAPLYAEFGQGSAPVRPDLGYAMTPRGGGLEAPAPQGQPPFDVPEANYSPTLDVERLQDSRAYQGLTREYGPETTLAPSRTVYMGREYEPGTLTDSEKRSRLQEAYADVYEKMGKPEQAMQLRAAAMQLRKGTLELEGLETAAEKAKSLRDVQKQLAADWKTRVSDRAPTNDDFVAHGARTAALLMAGGHVDEANAAISKATELNLNRMKEESSARSLEIPKALAALNMGDVKAAFQVYDRFIHDSARTTGVVVNKDGSITVSRTLLDGSKLPDHTFSSARELGAYLEELREPGAAERLAVNMFKQNIMNAELAIKKDEAAARGLSARASMVNATRPSTGSLYPVTTKDGKLGFVDAATGRVIEAPEGVSLTNKSGKQASKLTPEQDTKFRALVKTDKWQRAKTAAEKIRLLEADGIPADAAGYAEEDAGVSDW